MLARDEELEGRIGDLAFARWGHRPRVSRYFSENNYVCRLGFDGLIPDRVIKVGLHLAGAVRQEAEALRRVRAAGLEVPEVELTGEDVPESQLTFFVMPHLGEMDLGKACVEGLDWAEAACERAGDFLRRLQALPLSVLDGLRVQHYTDLTHEHPGSRWEWLAGIERQGRPGESLLALARARVAVDVAAGERVVVHESFIPVQVITDGGDVFGVTDWETIRSGRPLQDVSVFGAGLRAWFGGNPRYFEALIRGLTGGRGLSEEEQAMCRAWECLRCLWWAEFGMRSGREEMAEALIAQAQEAGRDL